MADRVKGEDSMKTKITAVLLCLALLMGVAAVPTVSSASFGLSGKTLEISGVRYWYDVSMNLSGNGNVRLECIYYDIDGDFHVLLSSETNNVANAASKMDETYINGTVVTNVDERKGQYRKGRFGNVAGYNATACRLFDREGDLLVTYAGDAKGFVDITVGQQNPTAPPVEITQIMTFFVNSNTGGNTQGNAWNIGSPENPVIITPEPAYELEKTVYAVEGDTSRSGDGVTVEPGERVTYAVTVRNGDKFPLEGVRLTDTPPAGVLEDCTVGTSPDGGAAARPDAAGNIPIAENMALAMGGTATYYISGTVTENAPQGVCVNTVRLTGDGLVSLQDTADVAVRYPAFGTLTLQKQVVANAPTAADAAYIASSVFLFHVYDPEGALLKTVILHDGESFTETLPAGTYTVAERPLNRYTCGWADGKTAVAVGANAAVTLTCTNTLEDAAPETGALTLQKRVVKERESSVIPEGTVFTFTLTDASGAVCGEIQLAPDESHTFASLPVGTYTVTETPVTGFRSDWPGNSRTVTVTRDNDKRLVCINTLMFGGFGGRSVGTLLIQKTGADPADGDQTFLFRVKGAERSTAATDMTVAVHGNGFVTLTDLPIGVYTVTELTDWSWRYQTQSVTCDGVPVTDGKITVTPVGVTVVFRNAREHGEWLTDDGYAVNRFTGEGGR